MPLPETWVAVLRDLSATCRLPPEAAQCTARANAAAAPGRVPHHVRIGNVAAAAGTHRIRVARLRADNEQQFAAEGGRRCATAGETLAESTSFFRKNSKVITVALLLAILLLFYLFDNLS